MIIDYLQECIESISNMHQDTKKIDLNFIVQWLVYEENLQDARISKQCHIMEQNI